MALGPGRLVGRRSGFPGLGRRLLKRRTLRAGTLPGDCDHFLQIGRRTEPEIDRALRLDIGDIAMGPAAHRFDGRLGGADQAADLGITEFGIALQEPGDSVGPVLPLRDRRVAGALLADLRERDRRFRHFQPGVGILFTLLDLRFADLAVGDRVEALHARRDLAVRDRLNLEDMKAAVVRDLIECQRRIVDQPNSGRLWHERLCHHTSSSFKVIQADRGLRLECRAQYSRRPRPGQTCGKTAVSRLSGLFFRCGALLP